MIERDEGKNVIERARGTKREDIGMTNVISVVFANDDDSVV